MSEWWSYRLSDFLLFSPRTYYRLFELHNVAMWPMHVAALALGVALLVLALRGRERAAGALLAACWLWVAWAFLLQRYATINWAAPWFAAGFAIEGIALLLASAFGAARTGHIGWGWACCCSRWWSSPGWAFFKDGLGFRPRCSAWRPIRRRWPRSACCSCWRRALRGIGCCGRFRCCGARSPRPRPG
ncbi:MAG TPA: hypothetical protein VGF26_05300 [Ramlibacter sp.]